MEKALSVFILTMVCDLWNPNTTYATQTFKIGQKTFLLDGKPFVVKAAEMHYPRIPRPYWEHRIQMCKALGMNTICSSSTSAQNRPSRHSNTCLVQSRMLPAVLRTTVSSSTKQIKNPKS